jgi:hypothetical protein
MPSELLAIFLRIVEEVFRPALTRPSFRNMLVLVVGWIVSQAPLRAITEALVVTGVAGRRHHEAFHRFFSRGTWSLDEIGYFLLRRLEALIGPGPLRVVIDDTLAPKKGPHVFGLGTHLDPVRSTRKHRIFAFGHCWVTLAVLVHLPFSRRTWALPVLFRLYRNIKDHETEGTPYRKKTELAREMLDAICRWFTGTIEVCADAAYCNDTVMHSLPERVVFFGAMRPDAVLTAAPTAHAKTGRPRKRGDLLPKPEQLAHDDATPWQSVKANLYGKLVDVRYKELCAQWYRACGTRLLRIVVVATPTGSLPLRVFFCSDPARDVRTIVETYACRWAIEVCFRDLKQLFGFADSTARARPAVLRVAPFVGLLYSVLVIWFAEEAWKSKLATPPLRPWYQHKRDHCFSDILRAARRMLDGANVLDPASDFMNLTKPWPRPGSREGLGLQTLPQRAA